MFCHSEGAAAAGETAWGQRLSTKARAVAKAVVP